MFVNTIVGVEEQLVPVPAIPKLVVYPNPFKNTTNIKYEIRNPKSEIDLNLSTCYSLLTTLNIYDASGRLVKNLQPDNTVVWDGTDNQNNKLPSGVYLIEAKIDNNTIRQKVVINR